MTLLAQYGGSTQFHAGSWIPTTSFVVQETFPTGKYDRLDASAKATGFRGQAYTTTLALYSQTYSGCQASAFCVCASTGRRRFPIT